MQAYPFVVRKVLRNSSSGSRMLLRDIVFDANGKVKPTRMSAILNAALGHVAEQTDGFVDFDAVPAEGAPLQVNTQPEICQVSHRLGILRHFMDLDPSCTCKPLSPLDCGSAVRRSTIVAMQFEVFVLRAGGSVGFRSLTEALLLANEEVTSLQDVLAFLLSPEARDLRPLLLQVRKCDMSA